MDLKKYPNCTLVLSEATVDCREQTLDPADPHCVRLSLSGAITTVIDPDELKFAKQALFETHPQMKDWPAFSDFKFLKLDVAHIWLVDSFGTASAILPGDYFASSYPAFVQREALMI